jgi:integrase
LRRKVSGQTKAEIKDNLKALHSELDAGLRTAQGYTVEKAVALTWEHVDLEAGTISVWRSVRAHGDTKTNRSRRTLKLPEMAVEALRARRERQAAERALAGSCGRSTGWCSRPLWERGMSRITCGGISGG